MNPSAPRNGVTAFIDNLRANGRYSFTLDAAHTALPNRSPKAIQAALRRPKHQTRITSPRRGVLVIVPVEYRRTGSPPAT